MDRKRSGDDGRALWSRSLTVSEDAVQKWEVGKNKPCLEDLKKISEIFCIDLMELIDDEKEILHYDEEEARNMLVPRSQIAFLKNQSLIL